jgi:hypothetical protein
MGMIMDELQFEELSFRRPQEKMDDAFCIATRRAMDAGGERASAVASKLQGINSKTAKSRPSGHED